MKLASVIISLAISFLATITLAQTGPSAAHEKNTVMRHQHREHGAHQHGAAKMAIAFEGVTGQINLEVASQAIYGFEYIPKKDADKKKQAEGLKKLETKMSEMVQFEDSLKCVISKTKLEVDQQEGGKHSDIDGEFKVVCQKSPVGSKITFNIQKVFPDLKDIDVQVIADDLQKSFEAKQNGAVLELKK